MNRKRVCGIAACVLFGACGVGAADRDSSGNGPMLRVSVIGDGNGFVASLPPGLIGCEPDCEEQFDTGEELILQVDVGLNTVFAGWEGDCNGMGLAHPVTMDADRHCRARFELVPSFAKSFTAGAEVYGSNVVALSDGGYLLGGRTLAGDTNQDFDLWMLRTDKYGETLWTTLLEGVHQTHMARIVALEGGSFALAGSLLSTGSGSYDYWLLTLDASGGVIWQKTYGSNNPGKELCQDMSVIASGGYVLVGSAEQAFGSIWEDPWLVRVDVNGALLWEKVYQASGRDVAQGVVQGHNGDVLVVGRTGSFGAGNGDGFAMALDESDGSILWQKVYGGSDDDDLRALATTSDGGYVAVGVSYSYGAGNSDGWVLKLNADGGLAWQKVFGSAQFDELHGVARIPGSGSLVMVGELTTAESLLEDAWLLQMASDGSLLWSRALGLEGKDIAWDISARSSGAVALVAESTSFSGALPELWFAVLDAEGLIHESCPQGMLGDSAPLVGVSLAATAVASFTEYDTSILRVRDTAVIAAALDATVTQQCSSQ